VKKHTGFRRFALLATENQTEPRAAPADLDGKPGDELVVNIPGYGLVALGMKSSQGRVAAARPGKRRATRGAGLLPWQREND